MFQVPGTVPGFPREKISFPEIIELPREIYTVKKKIQKRSVSHTYCGMFVVELYIYQRRADLRYTPSHKRQIHCVQFPTGTISFFAHGRDLRMIRGQGSRLG